MILIGQYDSPFTRRVAITLTWYKIAFEHKPWSVFGNAAELGHINPLIRVPTLVLGSGEALVESAAIIDYLDSLVAPEARLLPQEQPARYRVQNIVSLASGISDMAVRLFYEQRLHSMPSEIFVKRLSSQMTQTLHLLEQDRASHARENWFEGGLTQADIAVACTYRHLSECHPAFTTGNQYPALGQHCERLESQPVFINISQPFIAPA